MVCVALFIRIKNLQNAKPPSNYEGVLLNQKFSKLVKENRFYNKVFTECSKK
jgi:hypothetical protein